eukprot:GFKZ01007804.1.p1 GENE.GFKZ01007804.1~~GFKZ01007804.1.p1  ORF type:complete len:450 (-),score=63.98 GFKZ01007804.1:1541-2890(-)
MASSSPGISKDNGEFIVPWRNVSAIEGDNRIVYYAASRSRPICVPCAPHSQSPNTLIRHEIEQSNLNKRYPDVPDNAILEGKRVLLIANPASGTGSASSVSANLNAVTSIFNEAGLQAVVKYTTHPGHAIQILEAFETDELISFATVVSVGGDGTLHEVINGLVNAFGNGHATKTDWSRVPPISVLPGGSGNAIAVSTGIMSATHAGLNVVHSLRRGESKPLAVLRYRRLEKGNEGERIVIGGVQWGLAADVDQGTEWMRWMGDARFEIGALMHMAMGRRYSARIRVTVNVEEDEKVQAYISNAQKGTIGDARGVMDRGEKVSEDTYALDGSFKMGVAWNSQYIGDGFMATPMADITETGSFDLVLFPADIPKAEMLKVMLSMEDGSYLRKTDQFLYYKATRLEFERLDGQYLTVDGESVPVQPFVLEMAPQNGHLRVLNSFAEHTRWL